jgi:hypothetical protein
MPNRYEREIEEILRNLEQADPKQGLGQKFGERLRRKPGLQTRPHSTFSLRFTVAEWFLIIAVGTALLAGGYAYASGVASLFTGIVATVSLVCLIFVMLSQFIFQPRRRPPTDYRNVRPLRRGLFARLKSQWNLFLLKMRYRRNNNQ